MKTSNAIVMLSLVSEASSFMLQTSSNKPSTSLNANSFSYLSDGDDTTATKEQSNFFAAKNAAPIQKSNGSNNKQKAIAAMNEAPRIMENNSNNNSSKDSIDSSKTIWDNYSPIICQGGSLRTWSFTTPYVERVQVIMKTEGRPLNANIDLWKGSDNTPQKIAVFIEDDDTRPFCAVIETLGGENTIAIRNTAQVEFPLSTGVEAEIVDAQGYSNSRLAAGTDRLPESVLPKVIQRGAIKTYSFDPNISSVQALLKADGCPLNARIELLQGPKNNKQVMELYTEDGLKRPFYAMIETPGNGNVVRVVNTVPVEFALSASVEPFMIDTEVKDAFVVSGGGGGWDNGSRF